MKTVIYPGSFDPFTNGHLDIVKKAAVLFDEVYILIGINSSKRRNFAYEDMKDAILNACKPKGMPMMVTHHNKPIKKKPSALQSPPKMSQIKLPSVFIKMPPIRLFSGVFSPHFILPPLCVSVNIYLTLFSNLYIIK